MYMKKMKSVIVNDNAPLSDVENQSKVWSLIINFKTKEGKRQTFILGDDNARIVLTRLWLMVSRTKKRAVRRRPLSMPSPSFLLSLSLGSCAGCVDEEQDGPKQKQNEKSYFFYFNKSIKHYKKE